MHSTLHHAEDIEAAGDHVVLRGDSDRNDFMVVACRVTMYGGPGNDLLRHIANSDLGLAPCGKQRARIHGQGGNDYIQGFKGNDVLIGGGGRDTARGGAGTDRCVAEKRLKCER